MISEAETLILRPLQRLPQPLGFSGSRVLCENNFPHADYGLALGLRIRADYFRHGDNSECAQVVRIQGTAVCRLAGAVDGPVPWREGRARVHQVGGIHCALRRAQGWLEQAGHPVAALEP